ncbi:hypothetical protein C8R44DRAFT_850104 [Mycena epipterygia]|nr:hypothetical protein C8R44DRAFT_850104 [Mycena epipterygia]
MRSSTRTSPMSLRFHFPCVRGSRCLRSPLCLRNPGLTVTSEAERFRPPGGDASAADVNTGSGSTRDIGMSGSGALGDSGGSYHSEVTTDVCDGDVSALGETGVRGLGAANVGAMGMGDGGAVRVGDVGVGGMGGALRNRSLEKSSCVRDAMRRKERDIIPVVVGDGSGDSLGRLDDSSGSSK